MASKVPLLETEEDFIDLEMRMERIFAQDKARSVNGERKYHSSWRKRTGTGACENVCRKIDRIMAALERSRYNIFNAIKDNPASDGTLEGKDGLLDDFRDLRIYLALVEDYVINLELKYGGPDVESPHI